MTLARVYPIADTCAIAARGGDVVEYLEGLLEGGARLAQFRHKAHWTREAFGVLQSAARLCREAGVQLIVNDRADLAAVVDAGVHLGQDDLPPSLARRVLGESRLLGFSTHNTEQLAAADAEPADYLAIGPVFPTGSKENPDPVVGVEAIPALRRLTAKPLVAIGGITRENARRVIESGADSVAVIGDMMAGRLTKAEIRTRMEEWLTVIK